MRNRIKTATALALVIALGMASRKYPGLFPGALGKYPGDALWAVAVWLGWAFVMPGVNRIALCTLALASSFLVEFSQLYHAPWIDSIRSTSIGHLFLGSTYNPMDLLAYTAGVLMVFMVEYLYGQYRSIQKHSA